MDEQTAELVERRIDALERRCRRLAMLAIVAFLLAGTAAGATFAVATRKSIAAENLVIRDEQGNRRIEMEAKACCGRCGITLYDRAGKVSARFYSDSEPPRPGIMLFDHFRTPRIRVALDPKGLPDVYYANPKGAPIWSADSILGSTPDMMPTSQPVH